MVDRVTSPFDRKEAEGWQTDVDLPTIGDGPDADLLTVADLLTKADGTDVDLLDVADWIDVDLFSVADGTVTTSWIADLCPACANHGYLFLFLCVSFVDFCQHKL